MTASNNTLITPTIIAKEALMMLENSMVMGNLVHRQYKKEFAKVGGTVNIRKPNKFRATKSRTMSKGDLAESNTNITVSTQAHVAWGFSTVELTLTVEDYSERYIKPAAMALANQIDVDLCNLYDDVANHAGTPGTTPSTFKSLGDCQRKLDDEAAPSPRAAVVSPNTNWSLADGLKGTFAQRPATDIFTRGYLGTVAGLDIHMDQNVGLLTNGVHTTGSTPVMSDTSTAGDTSVSTSGWASGAASVATGAVFTIAAVYAVNPVSGASTGVLKQFVCTTGLSDTAGAMEIPIQCALYATTAYQTVSALPQSAAALTMVGTESTSYRQNLVFHPNAFALVVLPLAMPAGVWGARETYNNVSIRVVKDFDITNDEEIIRLDVLYGVKTLYPELACRLTE